MRAEEEIIDRARQVMAVAHYAYKSEKSYLGWISRYMAFLRARRWDPDDTSERKVEAFLTMLAIELKVSASTQNQAFAAILFLYRAVLRQPLKDVDALRANRPKYERASIPFDQLIPVLNAVEDRDLPVKLILFVIYGNGLRVNEGLDLRVKDVRLDDPKPHLVLRECKNNKDRVVPFPEVLMLPMRRQLALARAMWERDVAAGLPCAVPDGLGRKYPRLGFSPQWAWVFPAPRPCVFRGKTVRYRVHESAVQRALKIAAAKFHLDGLLTPHVLRHCYATHFKGDVQVLQKLMGHSQIDTTMGYRHPEMESATSPLDELAEVAA